MYRQILYTSLIFCLFFSADVNAQKLEIYTEDVPTLNFKDKNGKLTGSSVEVVQEIQRRIHSKDQIILVPWARAYNYITDPNKTNVAVFSMTFTEERHNLFKWVGPIMGSSWQFFAKADSDIVINNLEDAKRVHSIGTYRGDAREVFLESKEFTNLDSVSTYLQNLHKLLSGRITLWVASDAIAAQLAKSEGIAFDQIKSVYTLRTTGIYIAFHKKTPDTVVKTWQQAYEEIKKDGTLDRILMKWDSRVPDHVIPAAPQL